MEKDLRFCRFYKGEDIHDMPAEYKGTYKQSVWVSECVISSCHFKSQEDFDRTLGSHMGTWNPYSFREALIQLYTDYPAPDYQARVLKTFDIELDND